MKKFVLAAAAAVALSVSMAVPANAAITYDADLVAPGVYFGSGNANGGFTVNTIGTVELALRGREYLQNTGTPALSVYTLDLGQIFSLDWSFNPGGASTAGLTSTLTITNVGTGGMATIPPHLFPDNDTSAGAAGAFQNSQRLSFGFLNGASIFGDIDYDADVDSTYKVAWTLSGADIDPMTVRVTLVQGAGAVPEPGAWALMIMGFGGVGAVIRRRRLALA
jgi:hypothetical protein